MTIIKFSKKLNLVYASKSYIEALEKLRSYLPDAEITITPRDEGRSLVIGIQSKQDDVRFGNLIRFPQLISERHLRLWIIGLLDEVREILVREKIPAAKPTENTTKH